MPRSREGFSWTPKSVSYGLETEAVVPSTIANQLRRSYDAIVIGAGFTGLVAARNLASAGASVLLLEARDRIGGRTWTASAWGEQVEVGGTWFHWNQPNIWVEIKRYGLEKHIYKSNGTSLAEKCYYKPRSGPVHEIKEEEMIEGAQRIADRFFSPDGYSSRELMPFPHDPFREGSLWMKYDHLSIKDRLDQIEGSRQEKDWFETLMGSIGSAPGRDIGFVEPLRWYAFGGYTIAGLFEVIETFKLTGGGGMTALARGILSDYHGHVKMSTVVESIAQDPRGVTVTTKAGEFFRAKYTACTIPHNCLGDITFSPPLSANKFAATSQSQMNIGGKIHFKLSNPQPAWFSMAHGDSQSPYVLAFSDHNGTGTNQNSGCYVIGFTYNNYLRDREASKNIISGLKSNMKPDAEVISYLTHDWFGDEFAKGAWSCFGPGEMSKNLRFLQESHGRVLMASSDWASGWRGFIDGAIEEGRQAAANIIDHLGHGLHVSSHL